MITTINEFRKIYETEVKPLSHYIGDEPRVDDYARNWNEEMFLQEGSEPINITEPIFETPFKKSYFGGKHCKALNVKEVYAVADDKLWNKRKLLVMKYV